MDYKEDPKKGGESMKKILVLIGIILFSASMLATEVCAEQKAAPKDWPVDIVFGGGPSPASSHYLLVAYLGNQLRKEYGIRSTPVPGNSEKNCLAVAQGERAVAMAVGPIPGYALNGEQTFARVGPQKALRLMTVTSDIYFAFFALKRTGINSIADLRGKKLAGDYKGASYMLMLIKEILPAYGLTEKDVIIGVYGKAPEAWNNVASGLADAGASIGPHGLPWVKEFFMKYDGMFIPLSENAIKRAASRWNWVFPGIIAPGLYRGVDKEVPTLKLRLNLLTNRDLPDDFVYQLLDYMYGEKYRSDFEKVHRVFAKEVTVDRAVTNYTVPYHAGAVKYYKEKGVWNSTVDKWQKDFLKRLGEKR